MAERRFDAVLPENCFDFTDNGPREQGFSFACVYVFADGYRHSVNIS